VLTYPEGTLKKSVGKIRKLLAFAEGAVKKVLQAKKCVCIS
jgi:hypothetical protein